MKTLKNLILVLLVSLAVTACSKKDDDGGDGGTAGSGEVTAKVDGSSFSSLEIASTASISSGGNTVVTLQGSDASGKGIIIIINPFDGVGTYEIGDSSVFTLATYVEANASNPQNSQTWSAPYEDSGVVGEINVSEKTDTNIKGTFNFKAKNVNGDQSIKNITNGSFNLSF